MCTYFDCHYLVFVQVICDSSLVCVYDPTVCGYAVELHVAAKHICNIAVVSVLSQNFIYFGDVFFPLSVMFSLIKSGTAKLLLYVTYVVFFLVVNNIGPFNIHCSSLSINWHGRWGGWGERCVI